MLSKALKKEYEKLLLNVRSTRKHLEAEDLSDIEPLIREHGELMDRIRNLGEAPDLSMADLIRDLLTEMDITRRLMESKKTEIGQQLHSSYNQNKINRAYGL